MDKNDLINVAVFGASGSVGGELCRLLLNHPGINKIYPVSRSSDSIERHHPNLLGCGLKFYSIEDVAEAIDSLYAVFFCTPSGEAMQKAGFFLDRGVRVIDLSADFRFSDPKLYETVHGIEHKSPVCLEKAVYGVTELNREKIKKAELVANPGCYVITTILALYPLLRSELIDSDKDIHISAINGTSGAGSNLKAETMHATASNNILPYNLDGHRHGPELNVQLSKIAGREVSVVFSTAHGPFPRGIFVQISVSVNECMGHVSRDALLGLYKEFYGENGAGEPFVMLTDCARNDSYGGKDYSIYPHVARVMGSNYCHIGLDYDVYSNKIKIVAVTDNLVKGAAGSAIQNLNVMRGFSETAGLKQFGL